MSCVRSHGSPLTKEHLRPPARVADVDRPPTGESTRLARCPLWTSTTGPRVLHAARRVRPCSAAGTTARPTSRRDDTTRGALPDDAVVSRPRNVHVSFLPYCSIQRMLMSASSRRACAIALAGCVGGGHGQAARVTTSSPSGPCARPPHRPSPPSPVAAGTLDSAVRDAAPLVSRRSRPRRRVDAADTSRARIVTVYQIRLSQPVGRIPARSTTPLGDDSGRARTSSRAHGVAHLDAFLPRRPA